MKTIISTITASFMALTMLASNPSEPAGRDLQIDTKNSTIYWTGKKVTGEHTGTLMIKSGNVSYENGIPTSVDLTLDMRSIVVTDLKDADMNKKLTGHLNSPDFFSTKKHATGKFEANKFTPIEGAEGRDANYTVEGTLTIKGISKPISFPAYITVDNGMISASGAATFNRTHYDIRYGSDSFFDNLGDKAIYDDVEFNFVLTAK